MLSLSIIPHDGSLGLDAQQPIVGRRKALGGGATGASKSPTSNSNHLVSPGFPRMLSSPERRHVSFASPTSLLTRSQSSVGPSGHKQGHAQTDERRLGVHLAADDVLVPAVDRCAEVENLLFTDQHNFQLRAQLETLFRDRRELCTHLSIHADEVDDWTLLHRLLTQVSRQQLSDRIWLTTLRQVIMPRSARLWCSLSDCLGTTYTTASITGEVDEGEALARDQRLAELLAVDHESQRQSDSQPDMDDLLASQKLSLSTSTLADCELDVEVLHDVPAEFRKTAASYVQSRPSLVVDDADNTSSCDSGAIDIPHAKQAPRTPPAKERLSSFSLSGGNPERVMTMLETSKNSFAGIRVRLDSSSPGPSPISSPSAGQARGRSLSSGSVQMRPPQFAKFRRLSSLFMTSNVGQTSAIAPASPPRHLIGKKHHMAVKPGIAGDKTSSIGPFARRQRSESEGLNTDRLPKASAVSSSVPVTGKSLKTVGFKRPDFSMERSLSMSSCTDMDSSVGESSAASRGVEDGEGLTGKKKHLFGLMPDGRTRHPSSAGQNVASLAERDAFRKSVKISPDSTESHRLDAAFFPEAGDAAFSPLTLSCSSLKTQSDGMSLMSGGLEMSPFGDAEDADRNSFNLLGAAQADQLSFKRDAQSGSQGLSKLTAQGSPGSRKSLWPDSPRMERLSPSVRKQSPESPATKALIFPIPPSKRFSRPHELTVRLDEASQNNSPAWAAVQEALRSGREDSDGIEGLKTQIARCGERTETSDEDVVERLARRCFKLVDMDAPDCDMPVQTDYFGTASVSDKSGNLGVGADGSSASSGPGAKTPLDVYYFDDVEGYERRWRGFQALLRDIWLVDDAVLRKVHERCGPAQRLDLSATSAQAQRNAATTSGCVRT